MQESPIEKINKQFEILKEWKNEFLIKEYIPPKIETRKIQQFVYWKIGYYDYQNIKSLPNCVFKKVVYSKNDRNRDYKQAKGKKEGYKHDFILPDEIIEIDAERRKIQTQADELRAKRKNESQKIGMMKKNGENTDAIQEEVRKLGDDIKALEEKQIELDTKQRDFQIGAEAAARISGIPEKSA